MTQDVAVQQEPRKSVWRHPLVIAAIIIAIGLLLAGMFYSATNLLYESGAGQGVDDVSGYTVTNIGWNVVPANPRNVQSVDFDLAPTAGAGAPDEVYATIDGGTTWITCIFTAGTNWDCDFGVGGVAINPIIELEVVAVENP